MSILKTIESVLGTPKYYQENVLVYSGDCLNLMSRLPNELFGLTVTSPPYNIGKEYEEIQEIGKYLTWCSDWSSHIYRLTKSTGAFWLNLGYFRVGGKGKAVPISYLLWDKTPFYFIQEIVWNYGAGVATRYSFSPRNEKFLWYVKNPDSYIFNLDAVRDPNVKYPNQKKNGKLKCNPLGKNPTDVWQLPKVTSGKNRSSSERTSHPAQFPVSVVERIILACSNPGDVVLDPFFGSGSVGVAALKNARLVVGFELNNKYIDMAIPRLQKFVGGS